MSARRRLAMQAKLLAISTSRKATAVGELADAQRAAGTAASEAEAAKAALAHRYSAWELGLGSDLLGPAAVGMLATQVLAAEHALIEADRTSEAADTEAERRRQLLAVADGRVRAERDRLRRDRRQLARGDEEKRLAERTDQILNQWRQAQ